MPINQTYLSFFQTFEERIFLNVFIGCAVVPVLLALIFVVILMFQQQSFSEIKDAFKRLEKRLMKDTKDKTVKGGGIAICKQLNTTSGRVNGWMLITSMWLSVHHILNVYAIVFCILNFFNIALNKNSMQLMIALCSMISAIASFMLLYIRPERTAIMFRKAWLQGEVLTKNLRTDMLFDIEQVLLKPELKLESYRDLMTALEPKISSYNSAINAIENSMKGM